jgi:hypothetical protein
MRWALRLYGKSRKAYEMVSELMYLPSKRTLRLYRNWTSETPGINREFLQHFGKHMLPGADERRTGTDSVHEWERSALLAMDGMKMRDGWFYSNWTGEILGAEQLPDLAESTRLMFEGEAQPEAKLAKEVFQLMCTTWDGKHRFAIGYYLVRSCSAGLIQEMVDESIIALAEIGLTIRAIVCDGASEHRKMMDRLCIWSLADLGITTMQTWLDVARVLKLDANFKCAMASPSAPGDKLSAIFIVSDPSHLIKKGAENVHCSGDGDRHTRHMLKKEGGDGVAKWLEWRMFALAYEADMAVGGFGRLIRKVTREHIERNGFTRLKVSFSAHMLSNSMANALEVYVKDDAAELVVYVKKFDAYFDIMNSGVWREKWDFKDTDGNAGACVTRMVVDLLYLYMGD